MDDTSRARTSRAQKPSSTHQTLINAALLLGFALLPPLMMLLTTLVLGELGAPGLVVGATVLLVAVGLLAPLVGVVLLARRREGWAAVTAMATALAAASGFLVLDAGLRALLPERATLLAALRLALELPYLALVAGVAPWPGKRPGFWARWGLDRVDGPTFLLSLALAALLTLPWPVTGALGDRVTSLEIAFQTLAEVLPLALLVWGVVFTLLTATFRHAWAAGLVTMGVYVLLVAHGLIPHATWGALARGAVSLPLAFLLTELRARRGGVWPVLPVLLAYPMIPRLFVDPRDALLQGIPEVQHLLSYLAAWITLSVLALVLWLGRWGWRELGDRVDVPSWVWWAADGAAAFALAVTWLGLYLFVGNPGFTDDGFLIILEAQADLSAAYDIAERDARIEYVYDALVQTAERSQVEVRAELDRRGLPYRPYYVINMIRVDGHRLQMRRFADLPGVARVLLNPNVREYPNRIPFPAYGPEPPSPGVQANLRAIEADGAWELGVTGEGIVVAGQDTGYDWTHPALKPRYRGWDGQAADHNYNWHDAWDPTTEPIDDDSHGTHTMGTVLGDAGDANRIGVAPGARWIGCRNMRRGYGNPGAYAECMEFFLAPYPLGGDPFQAGDVTRAPHLINNSWGCPPEEGCEADTLRPAVEALRAAGIMMVVSAGNEGPACRTTDTPPANYDASFSVGATYTNGNVVGFSSRGPVDGLVKPDVAAPGYQVRSSTPGGGYGTASGTSMAGPHVAGLVALLWAADPDLVGDIAATEQLICRTATTKPVSDTCSVEEATFEDPLGISEVSPVCACGDATGTPNNVYGCGIIDAEAAVEAALDGSGF
jgi:subtilisin family serine protease